MGCILKGLGILFVLMVIGAVIGAASDPDFGGPPRAPTPESPELQNLKKMLAEEAASAKCEKEGKTQEACCWRCSHREGARAAGMRCSLPSPEAVYCFEECVARLPAACR